MMLEVAKDSTVHTHIRGITEGGQLIFGKHDQVAPGEVDHYECAGCHEVVRAGPIEICDRRGLIEFLQKLESASC
jgi:hypothetical protein